MAYGTVNTPGVAVAKEATSQKILDYITGGRPKRYGFRVKISDSDPDARVEYLYDAVDMTPAHMDYDAGAFNYGSWQDVWFVRDNHPVMCNADGSVAYALSKSDHAYKSDGATASDVADTTKALNAMSAIPCVWYKRWTEGGYYYFVCSEQQYDDSFYADVHIGADGELKPFKYVAMYEGSTISSKLRSLSGQRPESSTTASAELTQAEANSSAYTITEWGAWGLIHDLLRLMSKSCHCQEAFGQGHTEGGTAATSLLDTGTLDDKGQFFGYNTTDKAVKVFFIENFWGDRWDRAVGLVCAYGDILAKMNASGNGYNFTGAGYASLGQLYSAGGYIKTAKAVREGLFPTSVGGSDSTYECDYCWINLTIVAVALLGGACHSGSICGRYLYLYNLVSHAYWYIGASLSLK